MTFRQEDKPNLYNFDEGASLYFMACENKSSQNFNIGFTDLYYNTPKRHSEDFDGTVWTCPKDGLYKIRASFSVSAKISGGDLRIAMFKNSQQSKGFNDSFKNCLLYTSPSPRD